MKRKNNGFGLLVVILMLAAIVALALAGWTLNKRQNKETADNSTQSTVLTEIPKQTSAGQESEYFSIEEFSIKFKTNEALKGLYYTIGNQGKTVYFSLNDLKDTNCAADLTAQVALTRYTEEDFLNDPQGVSLKENARKIGNYYYFSMGGQSACSEDPVITQKASQLRAEIVALLPKNLEVID